MQLTGHEAFKFDGFMPLYNWIYPLAGAPAGPLTSNSLKRLLSASPVARSRALYFHIPFCDTICSFCPFVRTANHDSETVEKYVASLIAEIHAKSALSELTRVPIGAIFFGGGTPSLLSPQQLSRIGTEIRNCFDLSQLKEFSFECEVKSVTEDKIAALQEIGVTHARFGLQTTSPRYRGHFNLTATLQQVHSSASLLLRAFPCVSCDVLYGMSGETDSELLDDVDAACALGLNNLDFYPINDLVTQRALDKSYHHSGLTRTSELTKFYMRLFLREALKEKGFLPHNGHGWVRVTSDELNLNPVITDSYSFVYHEHTLGYADFDVLGFGANALSSFQGFTTANPDSLPEYVTSSETFESMRVRIHSQELDACKPIALALPYHGSIEKHHIQWQSLPNRTRDRLDLLIRDGLLSETSETIQITVAGWQWYTSMMYYLLPVAEQEAIKSVIVEALLDQRKEPPVSGLSGFLPMSDVIGASGQHHRQIAD